MRLATAAICGALLSTVTAPDALAQNENKEKALDLYKKGRIQFDLGRWDKAIELFQQSYEEFPAPALLFNIAQAYRHSDKCKDALFFYKRFLTVKPDADNKAEVEGFIHDLETNCKERDDLQKKKPDTTMNPDDPGSGQGKLSATGGQTGTAEVGTAGGAAGEGSGGADAGEVSATAFERPSVFATMAEAGVAFLGLGPDLDVPAQLSIALGAGYPLPVGPITLEVGAVFTYTPVPWENGDTMDEGTATLFGLVADATAVYPLAVDGRLALRGSLGLGMQVLSGVEDPGNVFIEDGMEASGALSMFHLRVGAGAEFAITRNLVASLRPVFAYSPPKDGMRESIGALTRFEILAGFGYRM